MSETGEFDKLFARHRRDAVLLHRPYPPHSGPRTNSHLGGLPRLPAHHEWPRTSAGTPLHFLAQIDCAELPFASPLPDRGVLFFFGRDDAEQVWGDGNPADDCRVLYLLDAFAATPPRSAPDDLPPIGDEYPRWAWQDLLRKGEKAPPVHIEWPVRLLRIDTWPDSLPEEPEASSDWVARLLDLIRSPRTATERQDESRRYEEYAEGLERRRNEAFTAATGEQPLYKTYAEEPNQKGKAARSVFFHTSEGPDAYPQYWSTIEFAARALLHRPPIVLDEHGAVTEAVAQASARWVADAEHWLARAEASGSDSPVIDSDRAAFRNWLQAIRWTNDESPLSHTATDIVFLSLVATVRTSAGDPARSERLPSFVHEALWFELNGFNVWGVQYAQMLGHAPSAQEALAPDDPTICLLNLASDYGLGWMFGDVGNATFWIEPDDLARRDFSKVWATIEGH